MNLKAWALALALSGAGPLLAQEDIDKQVGEQMTKYDTNKDGKASKDEYRAAVKAESEVEDEATYDWLNKWKYSLAEFLAADADDSLDVTREELKTYYELVSAEDAENYGTLTNKDIETFDSDYLEPFVAWLMGLFDADKNGKISQKEADDKERPAVVKDYDANKDGNLDAMEIKQSEMSMMEGLFEVKEGYKLKGEPSVAEKPDPAEIPEETRKRFAERDGNGDGSVTKAEMKEPMTTEETEKAEWWGMYFAFLCMDASDDLEVSLEEFAGYLRNEEAGTKHKLYPADRAEGLNEMWLDLDGDKDGKVTKGDWTKLFPGNDGFTEIDTNSDAEASKDEVWEAFKPYFEQKFEIQDKDRASGDTGGTPNPDDPMWYLYKKQGRSWTLKNSSKFMGIENVSYTKTEVVSVSADHCIIKLTMLDQDKNLVPGTKPAETRVDFKKPAAGGGEAPKVKDLGTETVKVEAGEFECQVSETEMEVAGAKYTTKSWVSTKHPGLVVKSETTSSQSTSSGELVEFKD